MLIHQHAMHAELRSALGCLVASIWINGYHGVVGTKGGENATQEKTWQLECLHNVNGVRRITSRRASASSDQYPAAHCTCSQISQVKIDAI
jgi:hypothetical protein